MKIIFIKFKNKHTNLLFMDTYTGSQKKKKPQTTESKESQKNDKLDLGKWRRDGKAGTQKGDEHRRLTQCRSQCSGS